MLRLAHVSDIHLYHPQARWGLRDWFNKRLPGWLNLRLLRRGRLFRDSVAVLRALVADVYERQPDCLLFSGDATSLGFEEEFALAADLLRVGRPDGLPAFAVPGNHDYYTRRAAASGLFEKYFGPWMEGERVEDHQYPFARKVGPVTLIGVNSCTGNIWFWDSTGSISQPQLDRLRQLLARPHIAAGPRFLVTHYPIGIAGGGPEKRNRRLRDLTAALEVAAQGGVAVWLHGHRHHPYHTLPTALIPIPAVCAGSGTQHGIWTYAEYTFDGEHLRVQRRRYQPTTGRFEPAEAFDLPLAVGPRSAVPG
jgi:3',5'-cyclic AMP phosphodiesterase CpdA